MNRSHLKFHNLTFIYNCASEPLFQNVSLQVGRGWTGVVGPNGSGKTTLLKLATGLLQPVSGQIEAAGRSLYCPQRVDDKPPGFDELISALTRSAQVVKGQLGICTDWAKRWATLSYGERKRAQLAVALCSEPDVLAVDEPTNHLDLQARQVVIRALRFFDGVGLVVSHDRELLDLLCRQCLFTEPPDVILRPGGISKAMEIAKAERQSRQKQYMLKKRAYKKLQRQVTKRRELARQSHKRRSKRGLAKKDHDGREKKDRARVSGKDGVGGKLQRQLKGRLAQAGKHLQAVTVKKQHPLGVWLPGSISKRNFLLELDSKTLLLGGHKQLTYPELIIGPKDRIAVTGANGAGKSTLIRHIVKSLNAPDKHVTYVPQEIDLRQSREILAKAQTFDGENLGHLMTVVSRLGSQPERLLASTEPSPGETRKLLLALGMTHRPHIIIMDEPTNHMDLPSVECLEHALSDCPCALVLVSHDKRFLKELTHIRWNITTDVHSDYTFLLRVT